MRLIAIALLALTGGLVLALILWRNVRRRHRRRTAGIESVHRKDVHAERWPKGWRGIPGNGDGKQ